MITETETQPIQLNTEKTIITTSCDRNLMEDLAIKSETEPSTSSDIDISSKFAVEETKIVMPVMTEMQYLWQCTCYRNFTRCIRISARSLEHLAIIFRIWLQRDPKLLSSELFDKVIAKKIDTVRSTLINTIMSIKALIAMTPSSQSSTKSYSDAKQSFDNHLMNKWMAFNDGIIKDHNFPGKHLIAKFDFVGQQGQEVFQTTFFLLMSEQENLKNLNTDLYINMSSKFIAYLEFFMTIMRCRYRFRKSPSE
ncbi:hypothetical protein BLA29_005823 [Euroglyphus maynei]|uniref:Uncharacterized protein n=1 Tax=Euroglyphus maynei TaxID=6958 RepID=A0A1Y3B8Q6_EURMA|nr:hypothetical protein BLA29_005823 [Euroglyphus maynei]